MGDDGRTTVRLGEGRAQRYKEDNSRNLSGLLRDLLDAYELAGDSVEAGLKRKLKDKESELDALRREKASLETNIENVEREIDELQDKIKQRQQSVPEPVVEFAQRVRSGQFPESNLDADNPAVRAQADNAGWPADRFVREVRDRL